MKSQISTCLEFSDLSDKLLKSVWIRMSTTGKIDIPLVDSKMLYYQTFLVMKYNSNNYDNYLRNEDPYKLSWA